MTRAEALRWWQAGYQAGHQAAEHEQHVAARWDRLVASYRAQHAADQQARINALLLETIDALAGLLHHRPGNNPARPAASKHHHRKALPEHAHQTVPNHVQTT